MSVALPPSSDAVANGTTLAGISTVSSITAMIRTGYSGSLVLVMSSTWPMGTPLSSIPLPDRSPLAFGQSNVTR